MTRPDLSAILEDIVTIAVQAGEAILEIYGQDFEVVQKEDQSPLTQADLASHRIICDALAALTPDIPLLSEESASIDFKTRSGWSIYWLIDPLDGTREFVNRNGEFTVNIALIENHEPALGVVHVPVSGVTYTGSQAMAPPGGGQEILRRQSPSGFPVPIPWSWWEAARMQTLCWPNCWNKWATSNWSVWEARSSSVCWRKARRIFIHALGPLQNGIPARPTRWSRQREERSLRSRVIRCSTT